MDFKTLLFIIIIILIGLITLIKIIGLKYKIFLGIILVLIVLFYFNFNSIQEIYTPDIENSKEKINSLNLYFSWIANLFENFKTITGNILKIDLPLNNNSKDLENSSLEDINLDKEYLKEKIINLRR